MNIKIILRDFHSEQLYDSNPIKRRTTEAEKVFRSVKDAVKDLKHLLQAFYTRINENNDGRLCWDQIYITVYERAKHGTKIFYKEIVKDKPIKQIRYGYGINLSDVLGEIALTVVGMLPGKDYAIPEYKIENIVLDVLEWIKTNSKEYKSREMAYRE